MGEQDRQSSPQPTTKEIREGASRKRRAPTDGSLGCSSPARPTLNDGSPARNVRPRLLGPLLPPPQFINQEDEESSTVLPSVSSLEDPNSQSLVHREAQGSTEGGLPNRRVPNVLHHLPGSPLSPEIDIGALKSSPLSQSLNPLPLSPQQCSPPHPCLNRDEATPDTTSCGAPDLFVSDVITVDQHDASPVSRTSIEEILCFDSDYNLETVGSAVDSMIPVMVPTPHSDYVPEEGYIVDSSGQNAQQVSPTLHSGGNTDEMNLRTAPQAQPDPSASRSSMGVRELIELIQSSEHLVPLNENEQIRRPDVRPVSDHSLTPIRAAFNPQSSVMAGRLQPYYVSDEGDNYIIHLVNSLDEDNSEHSEYEEVELFLDIEEDASYENLLSLLESLSNVNTGGSTSELKEYVKEIMCVGSRDEMEICCICQEVYEDGDKVGQLSCGHAYHVRCITKWIREKPSCPLCKRVPEKHSSLR